MLVPGVVDDGGAFYATLQYPRNPAATDVEFQFQSSTDLELWIDEESVDLGGDLYRITDPIDGHPRRFLRLKINQL